MARREDRNTNSNLNTNDDSSSVSNNSNKSERPIQQDQITPSQTDGLMIKIEENPSSKDEEEKETGDKQYVMPKKL
jgi:hypothetical protein